ncbi:hypothetical protein H9L21_07720 [Aeromicrobium senzhongii]|uniref:Uncharacterized protein n=1 Tax=Aeromicrobium senzhongii TaxID=2663859 RepID=A0ABX6SXN2_9ACTN|nr:hypothetical protein [Aeromicrobium senzhongii]MTB87148.1 hypothetical protein [Aeromicrobium senzhongii]QNL95771.1 hypothetical protein H9L21_07720 [Aeromicrobium senzhongii]
MTQQPQPRQVFEIRISGAVPDAVIAEVGGIEVVNRELLTAVRTRLRDQADLHGFLATLRTYGLEVVEVRRLAPAADDADAP